MSDSGSSEVRGAGRLLHLGLLVVGLACAGQAIWLNWCWLVAENQRIAPWKWPLIWSSELTAIWFFVRSCLGRAFPGLIPLPRSWTTLKGFLIAAAVDVGFSVQEMAVDRLAHGWSATADAQVVSGHGFTQPTGHRRYSFTCAFRDPRGDKQQVWFSLLARDVPATVQQSLDLGKLPVSFKLRYDPEWPLRSWPALVPYSDDNRLFLYSLLTLLFSGLLTALLAVSQNRVVGMPPVEVAPFLSALLVLYMSIVLQGW